MVSYHTPGCCGDDRCLGCAWECDPPDADHDYELANGVLVCQRCGNETPRLAPTEDARSFGAKLHAMFAEALEYFENDAYNVPAVGVSPIQAAAYRVRYRATPPPALRGPSSPVPPDRTSAEEERGLADRVRSVRDVIRESDAPILAAAAAQLLGGFDRWEPTGTTAAEPATEEERVTRDLVPLVRAAAAEVPIGDVPKLDEDLAQLKFFTSRSWSYYNSQVEESLKDARNEYFRGLPTSLSEAFLTGNDVRTAADRARQTVRRHENGADCWCGPVKVGTTPVHLDPSAPLGEARFDGAFYDVLTECVNPVAEPTPPDGPDFSYEALLATFDRMLAPPQPTRYYTRRVEPIKLTREQIDQIPRAEHDEFLPHNPAASWLSGVPVVEVLTVEESTPHAEGWCLTLSQIVTGVYSAFDGVRPDYRKPLHMTRQQIERVMSLLGIERPDDWEQTLERGGEVSQLLGRPVHLVHNAASSTPCIERWMDA